MSILHGWEGRTVKFDIVVVKSLSRSQKTNDHKHSSLFQISATRELAENGRSPLNVTVSPVRGIQHPPFNAYPQVAFIQKILHLYSKPASIGRKPQKPNLSKRCTTLIKSLRYDPWSSILAAFLTSLAGFIHHSVLSKYDPFKSQRRRRKRRDCIGSSCTSNKSGLSTVSNNFKRNYASTLRMECQYSVRIGLGFRKPARWEFIQ